MNERGSLWLKVLQGSNRMNEFIALKTGTSKGSARLALATEPGRCPGVVRGARVALQQSPILRDGPSIERARRIENKKNMLSVLVNMKEKVLPMFPV